MKYIFPVLLVLEAIAFGFLIWTVMDIAKHVRVDPCDQSKTQVICKSAINDPQLSPHEKQEEPRLASTPKIPEDERFIF